ncbi:MAG TPA: ECF transporter S component [bacterium]
MEPALAAGFFIGGSVLRFAHRLTRPALFTALGVGLGFSLTAVPNVELVTATIFLAGFILGPAKGLAVGAATECLYSLLNPYGLAAPPLLAAQVLSMAVTGLAGGLFWKKRPLKGRFLPLRLGLTGFVCTLLFDVLTTLSFIPINHFTGKQLAASVALGAWFYVVHLTGNTGIFSVLLPAVIRRADALGTADFQTMRRVEWDS